MDDNRAAEYALTQPAQDANAFNQKVWGSQAMVDTQRYITDGMAELTEGMGWGLMALGNAKNKLRAAIDIIEQMEEWK